MDNKRKSYKNLISAAVGQIVTIAFGLLLPRLYVTGYGSEVNGLLSSLSQILVYLGLFEAGIGAVTLQALYGPVARDEWGNINGVLSATHFYYKRAGKWYFAALVALSLIYPLVISSTLHFATIAGTVFFSGIGNVVLFYVQGKYRLLLQADGKNYILSNLAMLLSAATSLLKVILILLGCNIVLILAGAFLLQVIQIFCIVRYVRRKYPRLSLEDVPAHRALAQKNYMLIHQISGMVFQNTDVLILTVVCGLKTVSVYAMFKLVITQLESILSILINSVSFVLGQTFQTDRQKYKQRIDLFESYYSAVSFALFSVALFLFIPFMRLYTAGVTDADYIDEKLPILFILIALLTVMRTPMLQTINYAGHFKLTTPQTVAESVINLAVSLVCVFRFGIYGVLFGTIVALLYRTNDIIIYANCRILERKPWRTYMIYALNIAAFIGLQWIYKGLFRDIDSYFKLVWMGLAASVMALVVFAALQTVCMRHCRTAVGKILSRGRERHVQR